MSGMSQERIEEKGRERGREGRGKGVSYKAELMC